jgi:outer membrane lipoprotein SlyB
MKRLALILLLTLLATSALAADKVLVTQEDYDKIERASVAQAMTETELMRYTFTGIGVAGGAYLGGAAALTGGTSVVVGAVAGAIVGGFYLYGASTAGAELAVKLHMTKFEVAERTEIIMNKPKQLWQGLKDKF